MSIFCGPEKSSKGSLTLPAWFPPVKTPLNISTIQASPEPLKPAIGNWTPAKAFFASVVGLPIYLKQLPQELIDCFLLQLLFFLY